MELTNKILNFIKKEILFFIFLLLFVILSIIYPHKIKFYFNYIDWRTIFSLATLILLSEGIKQSYIFEKISENIIEHFHSERIIALSLVILTAILSTFLTNDITLFIVVPLTVSFQNVLKNDIKKIVIFEALAANAGSTLTPIGNPQNLFLWHKWNISFINFIYYLSIPFLFQIVILLIITYISFKNKKLEIKHREVYNVDNFLFIFSIVLMIIFIFSLELKLESYLFIFVFLIFLLFFNKIIYSVDWIIILLFILMFIDFKILSDMQIINHIVHKINLKEPRNLYFFSIILSQFISNVPASIFISNFSNNYLAIAYGVNIGGHGFLIGSLANIIALRLLKDSKSYIEFHKYSFPYLIICALLVYIFIS